MPVFVPDPGLLVTSKQRVGDHLAQTVTDLGEVDDDSLQQAVDFANAIVMTYLGRDSLVGLDDQDVGTATLIATRIAARIFRNPRDLSSFNYNEVSQSYSDPRLMTPDERMMLDQISHQLGFA